MVVFHLDHGREQVSAYEALTQETLPQRLEALDALTGQVGDAPSAWKVQEVGDGAPGGARSGLGARAFAF